MKLNDTHTILLSIASQRDDLAFYPLTIAAGAQATKAIAALIKAGLAERRGEDAAFATIAGLAAIGCAPEGEQSNYAVEAVPPAPRRSSKSAEVLTLLQRDKGASLPELIGLTGWLPHTTRAALTGLRKKGHAIERFKRDELTCYRIAR